MAAVGTAERYTFDAGVLFAVDEAILSQEAEAVLGAFADDVAAAAPSRMVIEGHTDSSGAADYNRSLSERRAEAVRAFLSGRGALSGLAFETRGAGEAEPVATNETEEGRGANRRVEIIAFP